MRWVRTFARTKRVLAAAAIAACAATATASAGGERYTVHRTAADDAAARAVLLSKADLGNPGDWTGGARKPNLSGELGCANYHPKVSDLVIVGAAAVRYAQPGIVMTNDAQVFRTPAMVEHDWQRGPVAPKFAPCLRGAARRAADEGTSRFVSFRRLSLPAIGTHAIGYRTTFDAKTAQGTIRLVVDIIAVTRGRSEVSLTTTMPLASVPTLFPNELVLAQTIVGRVRA
jgi:hypothetical protein